MLALSSPHAVGFDPQRLSRVQSLLEEACERREFAGAVYLVARHGSIAARGAVGLRNDDPAAPMTLDTIFDMASLTKPVATAAAALCLLEQGAFHLLQEVRSFFPEKELPHLEGATLFHLLTHTSGLPPYKDFYRTGEGQKHLVEGILSLELTQPPGAKYAYSCLGFILLQAVLERITGEPLDALAQRLVFEPLEMKRTRYCPPADGHGEIATAGVCPWRERKVSGEVHDPNAAAQGGVSGNAGLFSTAADLAVFAQMMLRDGAFHGRRILGPVTIRQAAENRLAPEVGGSSLGWFTHPNAMLPRGDLLSLRSFGHTGFTGTSLLIDPEYDLIVIFLANRLVYEPEGVGFFATRRKLHNLVAASLML
ncbi:MAG: beta-lactamase family protein [Armatimonadetes bacterium]|nr:beta-lactamase family protein [Armatimonadota bacterium]